MNEQQLRLIGIIALVIIGCLSFEPFKEAWKAQIDLNKRVEEGPRKAYRIFPSEEYTNYKGYESRIKELTEKRNGKLLTCLPYVLGILALVALIAKTKFVGYKLGILKI